jgi:hypothetical protein
MFLLIMLMILFLSRHGGRTVCAGIYIPHCYRAHALLYHPRHCYIAPVLLACHDTLSRPFGIISILFSLFLSMQAVLEPCEGELGCVLWDDAVCPSIAEHDGMYVLLTITQGVAFFALVSVGYCRAISFVATRARHRLVPWRR